MRELKHLTPYIPYGVHLMNNHGRWHNTTLHECLSINDMLGMKMILRPLSDLNKEMEFDGETFTPSIDKFWGMNSVKYYINQFDDWDEPSSYLNSRAPYGFVLMLIKWNFDVFGLIEKGLAIDKNTL